uniref:Uncharacterized protein n=1 Tax=Peronospora matthiolae TaxID=2874970 RepID=A0AAV1VLU8_9STRA
MEIVTDVLQKLNSGKAGGTDELGNTFYRGSALPLAQILVSLFARSLECGVVPASSEKPTSSALRSQPPWHCRWITGPSLF